MLGGLGDQPTRGGADVSEPVRFRASGGEDLCEGCLWPRGVRRPGSPDLARRRRVDATDAGCRTPTAGAATSVYNCL